MRATRWLQAGAWDGVEPLVPLLTRAPAVGVRGVLSSAEATTWARAVLAADALLVRDFGGEQHALGRAFYTHLETGRAPDYFAAAASSDRVVERVLPGMQERVLALLAALCGGRVRRRHGFCGPGVHVFPPGEKVARRGGVVHYDLEGLTPHQRAHRPRALSLVVMLQPGRSRGGITLWNKTWLGRDWPMDRTPSVASTTTRYRSGDALLFSSYRLHRIEGFGGADARVSITCHVVEVDRNVWDCWF